LWWKSSATLPTASKRMKFQTGNDYILKAAVVTSLLKEPVVGILRHATHSLKKNKNVKQATTTFLRLLLSHVD
jgi:hypothetical protein